MADKITLDEALADFDDVMEKIGVMTYDATQKVFDIHNRTILEEQIDIVANRIRINIGDNIAFEMLLSDLYSDFNANPSPNVAEIILAKLNNSRYYKNALANEIEVIADKIRAKIGNKGLEFEIYLSEVYYNLNANPENFELLKEELEDTWTKKLLISKEV